MDISIRKEGKKDFAEVQKLLNASFGQENESVLVNRLRKNPEFIPELSLVAESFGSALDVTNCTIVGYILFFPIIIVSEKEHYKSLALAPMAVLPDFQRKGIGKELIKIGLIRAEERGFGSVIVVGHPEYYPKFGFKPASIYNIKPPFDVPDNAFMAIELKKGNLKNVSGVVQYPEEFNEG